MPLKLSSDFLSYSTNVLPNGHRAINLKNSRGHVCSRGDLLYLAIAFERSHDVLVARLLESSNPDFGFLTLECLRGV